MASRFKSGAEFWPHYLETHKKPLTRAFHYLGTGMGLAFIGTVAAGVLSPAALLLTPVVVLTPLFGSHALIEKNQPATFESRQAIKWSVASELRMVALWCTGRLKKEYAKYGIDYTGKKEEAAPATDTVSAAATISAPAAAADFNIAQQPAANDAVVAKKRGFLRAFKR